MTSGGEENIGVWRLMLGVGCRSVKSHEITRMRLWLGKQVRQCVAGLHLALS